MAPHSSFLFLSTILTFSLSFHGIFAAAPAPPKSVTPKYVVVNEAKTHPGGIRFEKELGGVPATLKQLPKISDYILTKILKQKPAERKPIYENTIVVNISDCKTCGQAVTVANVITVAAIYLRDYKGAITIQKDFSSLLHHEMTHVWQWMGEFKNIPIIEGVADYTPMKANLYPPTFAKPGQGKKWDQGYDFTARFLEYCDGLVPDFTPKLNNMMKNPFDVSFFQNLTGKPVDQLWKEYKAKYGNIE